MEKDPIARAARVSADMATAGIDLWRQVLEQFREQQQDAALQLMARQKELGELGPGGDHGANRPDWQAYYQDNLERSIELSSGAWDAFYNTQKNLLQVCQKMAEEQGRLLEGTIELVFGTGGPSEPARLESPRLVDTAAPAASVDEGERRQQG